MNRFVRALVLAAVLMAAIGTARGQTRLPPEVELDITIAAAIAERNAHAGGSFVYREVGRTVDAEAGGVVYMALTERETGAEIPGIIDHLVVVRDGAGWRTIFPGQAGYRAAYDGLPAEVWDAIDDSAFRPRADPALLPRERLRDYQFPWEDGAWATVTRSYGAHGTGKIDFDLTGRAVAAAKDGTIIYASDGYNANTYTTGAWWYWNVVVIEHGPYEYSLYGHLAPGSVPAWIKQTCHDDLSGPNCQAPVRAGEVIGSEGNTGTSTNPHLHIEFGQQFGVAGYPDVADVDGDGDRRETVYGAHVYAEHNVAFRGYEPGDVAAWPWGSLHQASHRAGATPGENLVVNGDFSAGTEGWTPSGQLNWEVDGGVLRFLRLTTPDPPDWARFQQDLGVGVWANMPFEVTLALGNTSANDKYISVSLLNASGRDYGIVTCRFTVPAQSPLAPYALRGRTTSTWANVRLEISVNPPDGRPAALADDITARYRPELVLSDTECAGPAT